MQRDQETDNGPGFLFSNVLIFFFLPFLFFVEYIAVCQLKILFCFYYYYYYYYFFLYIYIFWLYIIIVEF